MSGTVNTNRKPDSRSFLIYENPAYEFKLKYPANWHKTEEEGKDIIASFAPEQYKRAPRLFLQVESQESQNITLNELVTKKFNHLAKIFDDGVRIVEQGNMILPIGNKSAYRVVYEFKLSQIEYEKMEIWMVKDDLSYTINYIAEKTDYDNNLPIVRKMVDSFEFSE